MGGRGRSSEDDNRQITIDRLNFHMEISTIRRVTEQLRARKKGLKGMEGGAGGAVHSGTLSLNKKCACCLHRSLPAHTEYNICPICDWIDDPSQNANPDLTQGSNPISLREARELWKVRQKS